MQQLITVNKDRLDKLITQASRFVEDRDSQEALIELLNAQKEISDKLDFLKKLLKLSLETDGLSFVEGDLVKVTTYDSGSRYKLVDEQSAPPEVLEVKLSPKAVENYVENNNQLPSGVIEVERSKAIRITLKG